MVMMVKTMVEMHGGNTDDGDEHKNKHGYLALLDSIW